MRAVSEFDDGGWLPSQHMVADDWEFPANCKVHEGQVSRRILVLRDPRATSVRGRLIVSGEKKHGFELSLASGPIWIAPGNPLQERNHLKEPLKSGDEFEFQIPGGCDYAMGLALPGGSMCFRRAILQADLPLREDVEIELARMSVTFLEWNPVDGAPALTVSAVQGEWTFHRILRPDSEGRMGAFYAPTGKLKLVWTPGGGVGVQTKEINLTEGQGLTLEL